MKRIEHRTFDEERALYGSRDLWAVDCRFDGPADGESAFKECRNINVEQGYFNLRYPFWHVHTLTVSDSEMTPLCRAALWYSTDIRLQNTRLHGIKALRECEGVSLTDCEIRSPEFGWYTKNAALTGCDHEGEYGWLQSADLQMTDTRYTGKYAFQYLKGGYSEDCNMVTKDAFWHAENVVVKNCVVTGEYLAWYSRNITFENCIISGTQPFCYCQGLRLINCRLLDADLAFEKSEVTATVTTPVISIKNPASGEITLPSVGEIIRDDPSSVCRITIDGQSL